MVERDRVKEDIFGFGSLGLIDITNSPINWVNLRKETRGSGPGGTETISFTEYGIHDLRLGPNANLINIKTKRIKSVPFVGKVIDLRWEGEDLTICLFHVYVSWFFSFEKFRSQIFRFDCECF